MGTVDEVEVVRRERSIALALLGCVIVFTIGDIAGDLDQGSTAIHVASELAIVLLCLSAGIYLWRQVSRQWRSAAAAITLQLSSVRDEAKRWESAHAEISRGLIEAIDAQLEEWGLSESEKDITFFIMKGLTFKEIAEIRKTSEHTVRQQAAGIYRKSGLEGRSQLSAFFLEDLLSPRTAPPSL